MVSQREHDLDHLFRRAAFGASQDDVAEYARRGFLGFSGAVAHLLNFARIPDDVDALIGTPGYTGITAPGGFIPTANIGHARQRWLFRMLHSRRPLQEKMTLFWHNHFATGYSKIAGEIGTTEATRMLAAKPSEDPGAVKGQLELLREHALGNFRDLLLAIAQDPAMLVWLDGRTNVRARPQENFARELMELFTMGVGTFAETDVYAGARVFTGWNLARPGTGAAQRYTFSYVAAQHDTEAKTFTFPIYPNGGTTIPARAAGAGMQDGIDLINAVAAHPLTGPRLARKLYAFFINDVDEPDAALVNELAQIYYARGFAIEPLVRRLLLSTQFRDPSNFHRRYSWPVEYVTRALKEVGPAGFSVNDALTPLANMGQQLFDPPDVNGWDLGAAWFSTGSMLARMNFASQLAANQKFNLRDAAKAHAQSPEALVTFVLDRLSPPEYHPGARAEIISYARTGATWPVSDAELATKVAGIVHLVISSGEYQFI